MPTAKVSDINIYYEIHGDGEPLLLIMGYGFYSGHWFAIRDKLSNYYRVVTFDNRGTGRSDKPDMSYTAGMMAGDAAGLLDAIGINAAHVFGVSMGGMIAQELALSYPDRIINLVLGCTTCGGAKAVPPTHEAAAFLFDPGRARQSDEEKARAIIPWLWNKEFIDNNAGAVKRFINTTLEYPTPPHALVCQGNAIITHDSYDRLPRIKKPTMVIAGAKDRLIPVENSKILASMIPDADLKILENAGHGFITDTTEESSRIILGFLQGHSKGGGRHS